jgi:hypothetical protein
MEVIHYEARLGQRFGDRAGVGLVGVDDHVADSLEPRAGLAASQSLTAVPLRAGRTSTSRPESRSMIPVTSSVGSSRVHASARRDSLTAVKRFVVTGCEGALKTTLAHRRS